MLINFIGTRGTHPSSGQGTMSFIVNNKFVFDVCPEFVSSFIRIKESWKKEAEKNLLLNNYKTLYGQPSFSKIEKIFLSHLHFDHWGGLRHLLVWLYMFQFKNLQLKPIDIFVPAESTLIFQDRFKDIFDIDRNEYDNAGEFLQKLLAIDIGKEIFEFTRFHEIQSGDQLEYGDCVIEAFSNNHIRGSLGYKIHHVKHKLKLESLEKFNIPRGPLLSKLQRLGKIKFKRQLIEVNDLFDVEKITLGYSGDTKYDQNLIQWFNDSHLLMHEVSYLTSDNSHHIEQHTELSNQFIENILSLNSLEAFFLIHISQRYNWKTIDKIKAELQKKYKKIIWHSPKTGDIINYSFKTKKIEILSLPYIYKF